MKLIRISPQPFVPALPAPVTPQPTAPGKESFGDFLSQALDDVNVLQQDSAVAQDQLVRGEAAELHQVMIAAEKAGISFDLLLEIRKKLLEAYQDLMRMPI